MTYEETDELQHQAYQDGYEQGVRDFAKRIRERDGTWSISEIEAELLEKVKDNDEIDGDTVRDR